MTMFENQQRDDVQNFIGTDKDIRRLYFRHQELNDKLDNAGRGCLPLSDDELVRLKHEKLQAKKQLQHRWEQWQASRHH
ncbi:YdcH family protein [Luteibacter sp. PPL201]|uniref:YdcH family protein n=1 Tax=Luteibacter sahnii TaxID=3021977 RepID=A0ABT6B9Q1_9GAMM